MTKFQKALELTTKMSADMGSYTNDKASAYVDCLHIAPWIAFAAVSGIPTYTADNMLYLAGAGINTAGWSLGMEAFNEYMELWRLIDSAYIPDRK